MLLSRFEPLKEKFSWSFIEVEKNFDNESLETTTNYNL